MHALPLNRLFALVLATFLLAACASQPEDEDVTDVEPRPDTETAETEPVDEPDRVRPEDREEEPHEPERQAEPDDPDEFYNHAANYDGSTDTRTIYFAFDRSEIPSASFDTLRAHARHLKENSNARVRLEGHTDERGTREYNIGLGERRAKSVEQFLQVQGVSPDQLETVSYGEEKPAEQGSDEMAWAKNRRVELNYSSGRP